MLSYSDGIFPPYFLRKNSGSFTKAPHFHSNVNRFVNYLTSVVKTSYVVSKLCFFYLRLWCRKPAISHLVALPTLRVLCIVSENSSWQHHCFERNLVYYTKNLQIVHHCFGFCFNYIEVSLCCILLDLTTRRLDLFLKNHQSTN